MPDSKWQPYSPKVMEHFMNPHNVGEMPDADAVGTVGNPACGDVLRLFLKIKDGVVTDAKFQTFGCGAAIATSSMATEMIKGKTLEEVRKITNEAVAEALDGLPAVKMHCSVLAQEGIEAALKDYEEKQKGEKAKEQS